MDFLILIVVYKDHACGVHDKIQVVYEKLTPDGVRSEVAWAKFLSM